MSFLFLSTKLFYVQLKPSPIPFLFFNKQQEPATQKQFPCKISTLKKKSQQFCEKTFVAIFKAKQETFKKPICISSGKEELFFQKKGFFICPKQVWKIGFGQRNFSKFGFEILAQG